MAPRILQACIAIMLLFHFTSCHPSLTKDQQEILDNDAIIKEATMEDDISFTKDSTTEFTGMEVPREILDSCFAMYDTVMRHHGFMPEPLVTPTIMATALKTTQRESFRYLEMQRFLAKAAKNYRSLTGSRKKRMAIHIAFGIYTKSYIRYVDSVRNANFIRSGQQELTPGEKNWRQRNSDRVGRIGVFLVTKPVVSNTTPQTATAPKDDKFAFDYGGLEP